MQEISLKSLAKPVTSLIMGSDYFHPARQEVVDSMLENYASVGGNTVDTAFIYSGGESEIAIGNWLDQGNRGRLNILTKGGHPNENGPTINESDIEEQLKRSLDRLKSDSVELYALHRDDPSLPVGQILEWLNSHVDAGLITSIGVSNWTTARIEEANSYAAAHGLQGIEFSSPNLSLAKAQEPYWKGCISADQSTIAWHENSGLPLFSWSSQARGFFTGLFSRDNFENQDLVRVFYNDDNWERYDRAGELAAQKGVSRIQIALAYVLNQRFPTAAIIGPKNKEEMESCGEGAEITLSKEETAWLDLLEA
ncbi:aldo/keto reductase [Alteribacillus sp. HJP-4]|uniref:aldo/keto reductase n=1 Tax=Alteribacillus sp. HJP-4 TaxID=2775394 RepID=UPI0035CD3084